MPVLKLPEAGVPNAPPFNRIDPADPTLTPKAVATPVPNPDIEPTATAIVVLPAEVN